MHFPRMSLRVILCSVLVGFSAGVLFAQDGKLSGKVADEKTNKPIALAQVTVLQAGVIKSSTTTNTNGVYHFPILTPGEYDLVVTYVGYVKQTVNKVVIRPLKTTFLDVVIVKAKEVKSKTGDNPGGYQDPNH